MSSPAHSSNEFNIVRQKVPQPPNSPSAFQFPASIQQPHNHQQQYSNKIQIEQPNHQSDSLINQQYNIGQQISQFAEKPSRRRGRAPKNGYRRKQKQKPATSISNQTLEINTLFKELIDTINKCYQQININKDSNGIEAEEQFYLSNQMIKEEGNIAEKNSKRQASTRLKRKPSRKYSHQEKQALRGQEEKLKRLAIRKHLSNKSIADQGKQDAEKNKDNGGNTNMSVQQILRRKLEEQSSIEKGRIFQNYSVIMEYILMPEADSALQIIISANDKPVKNQQLQKGECIRKFSIEKCMEVSVTPRNDHPN